MYQMQTPQKLKTKLKASRPRPMVRNIIMQTVQRKMSIPIVLATLQMLLLILKQNHHPLLYKPQFLIKHLLICFKLAQATKPNKIVAQKAYKTCIMMLNLTVQSSVHHLIKKLTITIFPLVIAQRTTIITTKRKNISIVMSLGTATNANN